MIHIGEVELDVPVEQFQKTWMANAYNLARRSPDPSTQNGALVLDDEWNMIGVGINDFTDGVKVTSKRLLRPEKYLFMEHAERNSLFDCLRKNSRKPPHIMVCPWAACADCARAIVQSGIKYLIRHARPACGPVDERWAASIAAGDEILGAGGVDITDIEMYIGCAPVLYNGQLFQP